ncbi:MAG: tRNA 2-thiouridine(34) synthase MnmA [Candidatus Omnitrophica bacterium]|nr:tRNA 2-thiouridine(34) synthase MnmA [Candidatus Omnitrophota bacterium]
MNRNKKRVLVAMSGGVDSSVSAYLLKKQGYDVVGITMCLGVKESGRKRPTCCGPEAIKDAKKVCNKLGIPHYAMDFSKDLEKGVIDNFISEYLKGRTPNPCVDCNQNLKFGILLEKARLLGFDFLATGHYAKIEKGSILKRARDKIKDQSYFLYSIKKDALKSILFPLGNLTKNEVRDIARSAKLPVADKPQSQDICFIPGRNYHKFLSERINKRVKRGYILDLNNNILGEHKGAFFYTVGQRGGLGIGYKEPLYVLAVDAKKNQLVVGEKKDLKAKALVAGRVNLFVEKLPKETHVQIRYNQKEAKCKVFLRDNSRQIEVVFEKAQEAITPGQSAVLYDNDTVLGGGVIDKVVRR